MISIGTVGTQPWVTADDDDEELFIEIPSDVAERYRKRADNARARRARYEAVHDRPARSGTPRVPLLERKFVVWDGEGPRDTGYSLLGNSEGMEICHPHLGTVESLELILAAERRFPDCIHVGFGFNYDVSNILCDLTRRHLAALHKFGRTLWRDYEIEHIPHKWFTIKHAGTTVKIYDIRTFFDGGLVSTLSEWNIGPWGNAAGLDKERAIVEEFKSKRADFLWEEIEGIRDYMRLELKYTKALMERLRGVCADAGYVPRSWHGPGALARMALARHKIYNAMAVTPPAVRLAAQHAFAGGRFEDVVAGMVSEPVDVADIHSAYPYFATMLPDLSAGKWRYAGRYEAGKFAVWHIRYQSKPDPYRLYPLFRRMPGGSVAWPYRTEGWYWGPEAELVADDADAEIIEGWVFDERFPDRRPFSFLWEYYHRRVLLKEMGNPAEWVFKKIINSIYGQLAQRAGWDRKTKTAPKSHQIEWAGWITSACRAAVYRAALAAGDGLISIDTDGVTARAGSFTGIDIGDKLGQWEVKTYGGGLFWQSGIYMLRTGDTTCKRHGGATWVKAKTRGIPRGRYNAEMLFEAYQAREPLKMTKNVFVGYGLADAGQHDKLNTWVSEPHEFVFGGTGKRQHPDKYCHTTCRGDWHRLSAYQIKYGPMESAESVIHYLPWDDDSDERMADAKYLIDDIELFDQNHLDEDEAWVWEYMTDTKDGKAIRSLS